ncbi:Hypothetical protein NTJ_02618 [Nesidiocoris tenuis]|nr:Hypothetical protein NTJ_02618 [Nesidiocoris tenuis]
MRRHQGCVFQQGLCWIHACCCYSSNASPNRDSSAEAMQRYSTLPEGFAGSAWRASSAESAWRASLAESTWRTSPAKSTWRASSAESTWRSSFTPSAAGTSSTCFKIPFL